MGRNNNFHRAFGVYGLYFKEGKLLVINKNGGPYINRFDLPGGSLEESESLTEAMRREYLEETGFEIEIIKNLGVTDFMLPWKWKDFSHVHHICVYYLVNKVGGNLITPKQFDGQDSLGAVWVSESEVSVDNASPLVFKAFEWLKSGNLGLDVQCYQQWKVKK
ncbi:NUDIX hydrolase [Bacillaceae bacterium CLA-AA-H227]|uniref:NUDIX hydrolase n=1 Tax=Robertmurraya yapensis (ex Hitch et al 2024) TaxID=3133160 RepID=A0ACC6S8N0_9BACI